MTILLLMIGLALLLFSSVARCSVAMPISASIFLVGAALSDRLSVLIAEIRKHQDG